MSRAYSLNAFFNKYFNLDLPFDCFPVKMTVPSVKMTVPSENMT